MFVTVFLSSFRNATKTHKLKQYPPCNIIDNVTLIFQKHKSCDKIDIPVTPVFLESSTARCLSNFLVLLIKTDSDFLSRILIFSSKYFIFSEIL